MRLAARETIDLCFSLFQAHRVGCVCFLLLCVCFGCHFVCFPVSVSMLSPSLHKNFFCLLKDLCERFGVEMYDEHKIIVLECN